MPELAIPAHHSNQSKHAWPFEEPVDTAVVTDYLAVVSDPIDLSTIEARLAAGFYRTKDIFCADLRRMCDNCRKYNPRDSIYFQCADAIEKTFVLELKRLHVYPGS
jgi:nucleosome-remodeling factor subunit BPTF